MDTRPAYDLEAVRKKIPILERLVPMNNCSQAPQMVETKEAAERYLTSWNEEGMNWERWIEEVESARRSFASLINASATDVAVCGSVSQATSSVASAFDYSTGRKNLVVSAGEFPTVGHVWRAQEARGAKISWVPVRDGIIPLEGYPSLLTEETLLVSACHGYYQTGFKQDLKAIVALAREVGALVYADAYQTLGSCPLDVQALDVDFLASGNLKFLMGIPGIAFLYVKSSVAETLEPSVTGWFGRKDPFLFDPTDLSWAPGARRFDLGTPPIFEAYVARAGMDVLRRTGLEAIEAWNLRLSQALLEGAKDRGLQVLGPRTPAEKAPTTAFLVPGDAHAVEAELKSRGIVGSARGPALRLAPHFYSSLEDIDAALTALEASLRNLST